jgi:hypothetical protein
MLKMILKPRDFFGKTALIGAKLTEILERLGIGQKIVEYLERMCYHVKPFGEDLLAERPGSVSSNEFCWTITVERNT